VAARRKGGPHDAVGVDVHTARIEAGLRHLVDLGHAGLRRVLAAIDANQITGIAFRHAPHRVVHRARDHAVKAVADERIELRIGAAGLRASACAARASTGGAAAALCIACIEQ
jgi:hypothetical protein